MAASKVDCQDVRFGVPARRALERGITLLERVLGPTLGPAGRAAVIQRVGRPNEAPEVLADGATIARRMTGIPETFDNMGFMLARHVAWQMHKQCGDGSATAVVIFAAAYRSLLRLVAAGADPAALRRGVNRAVEQASARIDAMRRPLTGSQVEQFVAANCDDEALRRVTLQAITFLGHDAVIIATEAHTTTVALECVEGAVWEADRFSDGTRTGSATLDRPRVLIWDDKIVDAASFAQALAHLLGQGSRNVLVVAQSISPSALAVLNRNQNNEVQLTAVASPHYGLSQSWALSDIAVLTGGRVLSPACGDALTRLDLNAVGQARRIGVSPRTFSVTPLAAVTAAVTQQIRAVLQLIDRTEEASEHDALLRRLGRLKGGMGFLRVGAFTQMERDVRRRKAEILLARLRAAVAQGVVPGGGAAYHAAGQGLPCRGHNDEERGAAAMTYALAAPAWWLAHNAGLDGASSVAFARAKAPWCGMDCTTKTLTDLASTGILEPVHTVKQAFVIGATAAALAISCDALVHRDISLFQADIRP